MSKSNNGTVLVLRTCNSDMTSYGGFVWPESGYVEAPDWDQREECGNGLHGFLWGEGDGNLESWKDDAKWLVCEVRRDEIVALNGKVKFPRCNVVYCGDRKTATNMIHDSRPGAIIGVSLTGGDHSTLTGGYQSNITGGNCSTLTGGCDSNLAGGDHSTITGGYLSTITGGYHSTITGGNCSTLTGGDRSTLAGGCESTLVGGNRSNLTAGECSTLTGGYHSNLTGGYRSTLTGGDRSTLTGGEYSTLTGGELSELRFRYHDGKRNRTAIAYVGEDGIEPNVPYRCNDSGEVVRAD